MIYPRSIYIPLKQWRLESGNVECGVVVHRVDPNRFDRRGPSQLGALTVVVQANEGGAASGCSECTDSLRKSTNSLRTM